MRLSYGLVATRVEKVIIGGHLKLQYVPSLIYPSLNQLVQ